MSDIEIKTISKLDNNFIKRWQNIWDNQSNAHFFNSPDWFQACLQAFNIKNYSIFVVYQNQQIQAILPTVKSKKFGINFLASPGGKYLDRNSLLVNNNLGLLPSVIEKISKHANIYLAEVGAGVQSQLKKVSLSHEASINPYISLNEDPLRFLPKKQKRDLLRRIRKYKNFELKVYDSNLGGHLSTMFNIEKQSYKRKRGRQIFDKPASRNLYNQIASKSDKAVLAILYYQDKPISHMFGLVYKNIFMAYHMAYLSEYRSLVPGKILLRLLLPKLKEEGFKIFDFSRGDSLLKQQFTQQKRIQYDIYISKNKFVYLYIKLILLTQNNFKKAKKYIKKLFYKNRG